MKKTGIGTPKKGLLFFLCVIILSVSCSGETKSAGPEGVVGRNGTLSVREGQLVNSFGEPVRLKGMSTFWINWTEGRKYCNPEVVGTLVKDWGISVYRIAVGVEPSGAYLDNPETYKALVDDLIKVCLEQDIYVIVDWHAHNTLDYGSEEAEFFTYVAENYGHLPNILYEIWNEPTSQSWSTQVKPYCETIINDVIRPVDPDNIILIGSPTWSQDIHLCAADPIAGENLMYTLHFYAGTHGISLRDRADTVLAAGFPLFVSEWGTSLASGSGGTYIPESEAWLEWMEEKGISWCNWSVSDKAESSAALLPGASVNGNWTDSELSPSGLFVRELIRY